MKIRTINQAVILFCAVVLTLSLCPVREACSENYSSLLVSGLLRLGYPLTRDDVVALDKISMRFDTLNRVDVLTRIIEDRQHIHSLDKGESYEKTEVICYALRLLNEMDLPLIRDVVGRFAKEKGWQEKERRLLAYMAAKRDIDYAANVDFLIAAMPSQETDLKKEWGGEISLSIMDICDNLSSLTELYIYQGDRKILDALITYAGRVYGYPKEYLSYMFVEILLQRPRSFINILTEKNDEQVGQVINSLLFAIWRNDAKSKVDALMEDELGSDTYWNNPVVNLFRQRLAHFAEYNEMKRQKKQAAH